MAGVNPETVLMHSRAAVECNQAALRMELKSMYIRKAYRCGMTLDGYCARFGINKAWGKASDNTTEPT